MLTLGLTQHSPSSSGHRDNCVIPLLLPQLQVAQRRDKDCLEESKARVSAWSSREVSWILSKTTKLVPLQVCKSHSVTGFGVPLNEEMATVTKDLDYITQLSLNTWEGFSLQKAFLAKKDGYKQTQTSKTTTNT